ncbi:MAG: orotidine-5'-phosphate decarboxylase [Treponema sp.]|jgi:orotidine-5'-phosphate decarboxylase|nr:orotidine-5'-phosphate decarboxylase [Treponema sp.]
MYNMDQLYEAVASKGPVCVGLDTAAAYVPPQERRKRASDAQTVLAYNRALVDHTADIAACYKVQIAYYEALGRAGLDAYAQTLGYIREQGSLVIADIKRGDIADTAAQYAKAHFEGDFEADFVTLSPYMGMDSIEPWLSYADRKGKGAFVIMRTSNPGMRDFEYQELKAGGRLYDAIGDKLAAAAAARLGAYGYGAFGVVVACTEPEEAASIRAKQEHLFFLIPGYGAQGGGAKDAALLFRKANGGVVNASRSILNAWTQSTGPDPEAVDMVAAAQAARSAVIQMRDALLSALHSPGTPGVS